eukprot:611696-Pyramimonas_sp.AAC.1
MPPEPAPPEPVAADGVDPEPLEPAPPEQPPEGDVVPVPLDGPVVDAAVAAAAAPAVAMLVRAPRDDDYVAPVGCSFRKYSYRIEAKLPKGVVFNGRNSRSATYGPTSRPEALAFA